MIGGHERQYVVAPRPDRAARVRPDARRPRRRARAQQRQRRRRLHRALRQPVPRPRAGPGRLARRDSRDPRRDARRHADRRRRRRRRRDRQGPAHRRRDDERRGSRARHRVHADGREQPHRRARGRRASSTEINASLPEGLRLEAVYDRTTLVDKTIATVRTNLFEGALLVIAVLFALLGNLRAALVTTLVIPLSMLLTITGMVEARISGNLMSLGALDFGLIVDGAVIIVENCLRRLAAAQRATAAPCRLRERLEVVRAATTRGHPAERCSACSSSWSSTCRSSRSSGVEGKMFHPMALTVVLALTAALVLSASRSCRRPSRCSSAARSRSTRTSSCARARRVYEPLLRAALRFRVAAVAGAVLARRARRRRSRRAWAASSSRASTKATSRCTRCAFRAPASSRRSACSCSSRRGSRSFPRSTACSRSSARPTSRRTRCRRRSPTPT